MTTSARVADETRAVARTGPATEGRLPWEEAMRAQWRVQLGDHPESAEVMDTIARSLAGTTADNYGRHLDRFVGWCEGQPDRPQALPASTATVLRWLAADVTVDNRVAASSLQPYLSALNRVHRDLDFSEPALGHLVQQYKRGLAHRQADQGRAPRRVYLPPAIVERLLLEALVAPLDSAVAVRRLRDSTAVVVTFCLFARGGTGSQLCVEHLRRSAAGLTVTLDHEKGKRVEGTARTLTIPPDAIPGLEELLARWESIRGDLIPGQCYFALQGERLRFPPSQIDTWLSNSLAHLDVKPPAGEKWTGHSLRKGAASGAAALDVALHKICYVGGWSIKSKAVFDYIDPTCPASSACRRFFGWLLSN